MQEDQLVLAKKGYDLALDATIAVIREGGGALTSNAVLGACLTMVGCTVYELELAENDGVLKTTLAAWICMTSLRMGAPVKARTISILANAGRIYDEEKEMAHRVKWVKRAVHYCRIIKRAIPQGSTALAMKAECPCMQCIYFRGNRQ